MTIGTSIWVSRAAICREQFWWAGGWSAGGRRLDDGSRIRGVDRSDRPGLVLVDGVSRAVLDVGDRGVGRMRGQPVVDEPFDDAAPAKRRPNVVPAALALEVADQLLVAGVPLARPGELRIDIGIGDRK